MATSGTRRSKAPKPTTVLFVRHGQTPTTGAVLPGRAPGLHLADTGRAQAAAVAERIAAFTNVVAVYSSPMERTKETAAPIAKALSLRVRTERGLVECDFGQWTGRELRELSKLPEWRTVQRHPTGFRFPKGESFNEMQTRMVSAVHRLIGRHPGEVIVAVSHADTIKAALADALGVHLDLFQRIVIGPCSVSAVTYFPEGPVVLTQNSTASLTELVPS